MTMQLGAMYELCGSHVSDVNVTDLNSYTAGTTLVMKYSGCIYGAPRILIIQLNTTILKTQRDFTFDFRGSEEARGQIHHLRNFVIYILSRGVFL